MTILPLHAIDQIELHKLHDQYFPDLEKLDFIKKCIASFVIKNDDGRIVMGGGVRALGEAVLVTDKSINPHVIGDALLGALDFSKTVCGLSNIELLHAFVKDENYMKHLIAHGFQKRSQALYLEV